MVINPAWEDIFTQRDWGMTPGQGLVMLLAKKFYHCNRSEIKILDLGTGCGANTWYLASEGYCTYGIDGSPMALEKTRQNIEKLAPGKAVDLRLGDLCNLPYENGFFDIVFDIASACANSRDDMKRIYAEAHRVLKPDGGIINAQLIADGTDPDAVAKGTTIYMAKQEELSELFNGFNIAFDARRRPIFGGKSHVCEHLVTGWKK